MSAGGERKVTASPSSTGGSLRMSAASSVWVDGEVSDLKRRPAWANVFLTLKDATGASLPATWPAGAFDAIELGSGRGRARPGARTAPALRGARGGELPARHGGARRRRRPCRGARPAPPAAGPRASSRRRGSGLSRGSSRGVGLVTGVDAAARGGTSSLRSRRASQRARLVIAETRVQGPGATTAIVGALNRLAWPRTRHRRRHPRAGRRGASRIFSRSAPRRVVRAVAASRVPIVSAVGHEQDEPLCDLAADVRADADSGSAPRRARPRRACRRARARGQRLDAGVARASRAGSRAPRAGRRAPAGRTRSSTSSAGGWPSTAAPRASRLCRPARRYRAATRSSARPTVVRDAATGRSGTALEIELARGGLGARVEDVRAVTEPGPSFEEALARAGRDRPPAGAGRRAAGRGAGALGARRGAPAGVRRAARSGRESGSRSWHDRSSGGRRLPREHDRRRSVRSRCGRPSSDLIRSVPIFAELDDASVSASRRTSSSGISRQRDQAIATEGEGGLNFFVVESGEAEATRWAASRSDASGRATRSVRSPSSTSRPGRRPSPRRHRLRPRAARVELPRVRAGPPGRVVEAARALGRAASRPPSRADGEVRGAVGRAPIPDGVLVARCRGGGRPPGTRSSNVTRVRPRDRDASSGCLRTTRRTSSRRSSRVWERLDTLRTTTRSAPGSRSHAEMLGRPPARRSARCTVPRPTRAARRDRAAGRVAASGPRIARLAPECQRDPRPLLLPRRELPDDRRGARSPLGHDRKRSRIASSGSSSN